MKKLHYEDLRYQLLVSNITWAYRIYESCIIISSLLHKDKNIVHEKINVRDIVLKNQTCQFNKQTKYYYREQVENFNEDCGEQLRFLSFIRNRMVHQGGDSFDLTGESKLFYKNNEDRICLEENFIASYEDNNFYSKYPLKIFFLKGLLHDSQENGFHSTFKNKIITEIDNCFSILISHIWSKLIEKINSRI